MNHHGGDAFDVNLMKHHHAHDKLEKFLLLMMMRRTSYLDITKIKCTVGRKETL